MFFSFNLKISLLLVPKPLRLGFVIIVCMSAVLGSLQVQFRGMNYRLRMVRNQWFIYLIQESYIDIACFY